MRSCPRKLTDDIAHTRRSAHDVGSSASYFAIEAERSARHGNCREARKALASAKKIIRKYWRRR